MLAPIQTHLGIIPLAQVDNDEQLISLWLHGKSPHSVRNYHQDVNHFRAFTEAKPLASITLNDVQAFTTALLAQGYSTATRQRRLSAVKSLLSFGHRIGFLPVNVAAPVQSPKSKDTLAERILTESQVLTMIALTQNVRDRVLIRFLYDSGLRVSELCQLRWRDLKDSTDGTGQATVFGKGGKTRYVRFSAQTWSQIQSLRGDAGPRDPVFQSRKKRGQLQPNQVRRIVEAAGERVGLRKVSPHWLRHSHASHALDRGAPIHLVQATLGHASVATTGKYLHAKPADSSALYLPR